MSMLRMMSALLPWGSEEQKSDMPSAKPKFDAYTTASSQGISRVYFQGNALSVFMREDFMGNLVSFSLSRAGECVENSKFVHRNDEGHDTHHKSKKDFEISHSHLMKVNKELITPEEFKCLLDGVMRLEKSFKNDMRAQNTSVLDVGTQSVMVDRVVPLTRGDHDHLIEKYNAFYLDATLSPQEKLKIEADLKAKLDALNNNVVLNIKEAGKVAANAFFATLMRQYIKPYLIYNVGLGSKNVAWAVDIMSSALIGLLSGSVIGAGFDLAIQKTFKPALLKIGVDLKAAEDIATGLSSIATLTTDPLQLIQLTANATVAKTSIDLAHGLIHLLPKLKTSGDEVQKNLEVSNENLSASQVSTLRKRR